MTVSPAVPVRRVLALAGSLRRASWNRRLLHAAALQAPAGIQLEVYDDLAAVPLFDEDLEQHEPAGPTGVQALRAAVAAADGVIIATPEYNQALSGVLKNALDWLSRESPAGEVLAGKPVAVLGASSGPWGTRLAQASLRQVLHTCGALVMPGPSLFVARAADRFDARGWLTDTSTLQSLQSFLLGFEGWMERLALPAMQDASLALPG
ncbi:MAG: NADPH-dependent FMN reductase [Rhodanobacter sp.]